jgi:hypothetical protein
MPMDYSTGYSLRRCGWIRGEWGGRMSCCKMTAPPYTSTKTFAVPEYLKRVDIGVTEISLSQRTMVFKFKVNDDMKGDIKILVTGTWTADETQLRNKAFKKGFLDKNIDLLVKGFGHIYSGEASDAIAQIRQGVNKELEAAKKVSDALNNEEEKKPKVFKHYVQKYHNVPEANELYEAVLKGKDAFFISIDRENSEGQQVPHYRLSTGFKITSAAANTVIEILPRENLTYLSKPYHFEGEKELGECLKKTSEKTLDQIYQEVKAIVKKYIAASDVHHTILAGDIVFTYFQDIFGQTHYLYFYGDNGTGKTINLQLLSVLAYRAMYDVDITAANIFTYYGTIEEGQGVILEDEADDIDYHQQEKMKIYKKGYNAGGKVSRTETGGDAGRHQEGYYVYGFKAFTGEERLDPDYAKGFNERTFYQECQAGDPEYDLSEVMSPAGAEEFEKLREELEDIHKTLLMYRLIHHTDRFPNIDIAVINREKQLVKPLIRLFQGTQSQKEIAQALGELLAARRGIKRDTLEYAIYTVLNRLIETYKTHSFIAKRIYVELKDELDGKYKDEEKDQSFETPVHGKVSHKKITSICENRFGAKKEHTKDGNMLTFDEARFKKVNEAYSLEGQGVQIIKEQTSLKVGDGVTEVTENNRSDPVSTEKQRDTYDGNRYEMQEDIKYSEETEEETEESEEEEEEENF